MKFLCNTEFYHSGVRLYTAGTVYVITAIAAAQLITLDKNKTLGALSFFTPVDEEAVNYVKGKKGNPTEQTGTGSTDPNVTPPPKQPTRAELIETATNLGIRGANFMKNGQLEEAIAAARQNQPAEQTGGTDPDPNATQQV